MNKEKQFSKDAINEMLKISGHSVTFDDLLKENDGWYSIYTMTKAQHKIWKAWFLKELKLVFKWSDDTCRREFLWFDLQYGLKIEDATG